MFTNNKNSKFNNNLKQTLKIKKIYNMVFVKIGNRLERLLGTQEAHDNQSNGGPWVSCIATIGGACW
jgi:hypothetical protein